MKIGLTDASLAAKSMRIRLHSNKIKLIQEEEVKGDQEESEESEHDVPTNQDEIVGLSDDETDANLFCSDATKIDG